MALWVFFSFFLVQHFEEASWGLEFLFLFFLPFSSPGAPCGIRHLSFRVDPTLHGWDHCS